MNCRGLLLFAVLLIGCDSSPKRNNEIVVFAASSTTEALEEFALQFEQGFDADVRLSFASSATLATQIIHGANADLFLSANLNWIDELESNGHIARMEKSIQNRLVIVVPADSDMAFPIRPEDLIDEKILRISIADPESVPAGIYAKKAMTRLKLWDKVKSKLVYASNVRHVLAQVDSGSSTAGIVYATDANTSDSVKVVCELNQELTGRIEYGLALTKQGSQNLLARQFFDAICNDSNSIFQRHGFLIESGAR